MLGTARQGRNSSLGPTGDAAVACGPNADLLSEGWVKVQAGKTVDRKGHPLLIKPRGKVEAFYR